MKTSYVIESFQNNTWTLVKELTGGFNDSLAVLKQISETATTPLRLVSRVTYELHPVATSTPKGMRVAQETFDMGFDTD
jgi:hypothetical protein